VGPTVLFDKCALSTVATNMWGPDVRLSSTALAHLLPSRRSPAATACQASVGPMDARLRQGRSRRGRAQPCARRPPHVSAASHGCRLSSAIDGHRRFTAVAIHRNKSMLHTKSCTTSSCSSAAGLHHLQVTEAPPSAGRFTASGLHHMNPPSLGGSRCRSEGSPALRVLIPSRWLARASN
jgi:hypothetical protein